MYVRVCVFFLFHNFNDRKWASTESKINATQMVPVIISFVLNVRDVTADVEIEITYSTGDVLSAVLNRFLLGRMNLFLKLVALRDYGIGLNRTISTNRISLDGCFAGGHCRNCQQFQCPLRIVGKSNHSIDNADGIAFRVACRRATQTKWICLKI